MQVREKEDRHQQQKISGFLQPLENIQAAREAAAAADMEVRTGQLEQHMRAQGHLSAHIGPLSPFEPHKASHMLLGPMFHT